MEQQRDKSYEETRDDYNWVPKSLYDVLLEKFNMVVMENDRLRKELSESRARQKESLVRLGSEA